MPNSPRPVQVQPSAWPWAATSAVARPTFMYISPTLPASRSISSRVTSARAPVPESGFQIQWVHSQWRRGEEKCRHSVARARSMAGSSPETRPRKRSRRAATGFSP